MQIDFANQKVLVTGGSRGIGKEIAKAFLQSGCGRVAVTGQSDQQPAWIEEFKNQSFDIQYFCLDLLSDNWIEALKSIVNEYEGFDVCINNAGINSIHHLPNFPEEKVNQILAVNLQAPILISGIVCQKMAQNRYGRIVNIASIFGVVSKEMRSAYTASKSGLIGVTKTMALDLASDNILVNSVSPGFIETELTQKVLGKDGIEEMQKRIPLARLGSPKEIASYVLFLASKQNTYMTGQNMVVDGGFVCA